MKKSIQDKIDAIIKQAQATDADSYVYSKKSSSSRQDSLAQVIKTKKQADEFLADLETAIRLAHKK